MQCSFTYGSVTYTYLVDVVTIRPVTTGEQRRLIDGNLDQNLHDLELQISVKGIFEQVGASGKSANQLWLDLLGGAEAVFTTDGATSFTVMPDLAHSPRFVETTKGVYKETTELRLISKSTYQEDAAEVTSVAGLRPHYGA